MNAKISTVIATVIALALTSPTLFGTQGISTKCGKSSESDYETKCIDAETGRPMEGTNGVQLKGGSEDFFRSASQTNSTE